MSDSVKVSVENAADAASDTQISELSVEAATDDAIAARTEADEAAIAAASAEQSADAAALAATTISAVAAGDAALAEQQAAMTVVSLSEEMRLWRMQLDADQAIMMERLTVMETSLLSIQERLAPPPAPAIPEQPISPSTQESGDQTQESQEDREQIRRKVHRWI